VRLRTARIRVREHRCVCTCDRARAQDTLTQALTYVQVLDANLGGTGTRSCVT
jgi:hypothetical protein